MEIDDSLRSATRPYVCGRAWRASGTGRRGRRPLRGGANPGERGRCGARGEGAGSEKVGAAICRPPTPDHNRRKRAAGSRPYNNTPLQASGTGRRGRRPLRGGTRPGMGNYTFRTDSPGRSSKGICSWMAGAPVSRADSRISTLRRAISGASWRTVDNRGVR